MTESKPRAKKVGQIVEAKEVTVPSGVTYRTSDGQFVLGEPGTYVIDGTEIDVK